MQSPIETWTPLIFTFNLSQVKFILFFISKNINNAHAILPYNIKVKCTLNLFGLRWLIRRTENILFNM